MSSIGTKSKHLNGPTVIQCPSHRAAKLDDPNEPIVKIGRYPAFIAYCVSVVPVQLVHEGVCIAPFDGPCD